MKFLEGLFEGVVSLGQSRLLIVSLETALIVLTVIPLIIFSENSEDF